MKGGIRFLCVLLLLAITACATTKEPRKAPDCNGKYAPVNSADKYPSDQGTKR